MWGTPNSYLYYGPASFFQPFLSFIFTVLIIVLIFRLIRGHHRHDWHDFMHTETHLDILKRRYAKGEITKKEFEEMKKDLS